MATDPRQETATIYQFPVRLRPGAANVRQPAPQAPAWSDKPIVTSDFGSGWYHDAAMREATTAPETGRKH